MFQTIWKEVKIYLAECIDFLPTLDINVKVNKEKHVKLRNKTLRKLRRYFFCSKLQNKKIMLPEETHSKKSYA